MPQRLIIVSLFEAVPQPLFTTNDWPLHITLLQPFILDGSDAELREELAQLARRMSALHEELARTIEGLGCAYEYPSFGDGYRPHVSRQPGRSIADGDLPIRAFSLVDRQADGVAGKKRIVETFELQS